MTPFSPRKKKSNGTNAFITNRNNNYFSKKKIETITIATQWISLFLYTKIQKIKNYTMDCYPINVVNIYPIVYYLKTFTS